MGSTGKDRGTGIEPTRERLRDETESDARVRVIIFFLFTLKKTILFRFILLIGKRRIIQNYECLFSFSYRTRINREEEEEATS